MPLFYNPRKFQLSTGETKKKYHGFNNLNVLCQVVTLVSVICVEQLPAEKGTLNKALQLCFSTNIPLPVVGGTFSQRSIRGVAYINNFGPIII